MPLHKSSRAHRLDPTMISAPLGDFRHTMHIGRGGDAFGDTSFLSTVNQSPTTSEKGGSGTLPAAGPELAGNHSDLLADAPESPQLQRSESVSSLTMDLDLDLDLGPSILGDVLGVMDGLSLGSNGEAVLSPKGDAPVLETKHVMGNAEMPVNGNGLDEDSRIPDENGWKSRGLKPKVRFSDKREEIIRQPSEDEEGQAFELHGDEEELGGHSPATDDSGWRKSPAGEAELTNHKADVPPSPASSHSSESDMVTELDRRRSESGHSETDSEDEEEEEEEEGRGYSFEDESDDEIGL